MNNCILYKGLAYKFTLNNIMSLRSTKGSFGSGVYFSNKETALVYAADEVDNIVSAYISIPFPLIVTVNFEEGNKFDFDSAALPLLRLLYCEQQIIELIDLSIDCLFGIEIENKVRSLGYDGLIIIYENESCYEVIVYDESSINFKSLY